MSKPSTQQEKMIFITQKATARDACEVNYVIS